MAFLALLAYPEGDRHKRDEVVRECKIHLARAAIGAGVPRKSLPNVRAYRSDRTNIKYKAITHAWHRIDRRRLPSAWMAHRMMFRGNRITELSQYMEDDAQIFGGEKNILTRVWRESMPVLHLAIALDAVIRRRPPGNVSFFSLLNNPDWVRQAIASAEIARKMFPAEFIKGESFQLLFELE